MKRIACIIVCLMFSVLLLCSCSYTYENSLFKHNYERDYGQAIVTIKPITERGTRTHNENNEPLDAAETTEYTSEEVNIYKAQLVNYLNNFGTSYGGMSAQETVDYFVEQLVLVELVTIEADFRLEMREIYWSQEDIDEVQQSVYHTLDDMLNEIYNKLLTDAGKESLIEAQETEVVDTTYPTMPLEEETETREFVTFGSGVKHDDWYNSPDVKWYTEKPENKTALPGNHGDEQLRSLAREGVSRLVTQVYDNALTIINLTDDEKKQFDDELAMLKNAIRTEGVGYAYSILGKTAMVKRLYGDSAIVSQKMTMLQDYVTNSVTVSEEEIVNKYTNMLEEQMTNYKDASAYDTAATGDDLVLYKANGNYVYVKHILIPFSDAQQAQLTNIKNNSTEAEYIKARNNMVNNIVAYKHVDGEDDKSDPLTVDQIWSEVRARMAMASADPYVAERTFDELIYEYNTDPGIFGNEYGYAVKYDLGGDSETYMEEFAEAARAFRSEGYSIGQIYNNYVVTDYGVHIMYYAADYEAGYTLGLNDYATPGRYTLVKDYIEQELLEAARDAAFQVWRDERVFHYLNSEDEEGNGTVVYKTNAFKNLYE